MNSLNDVFTMNASLILILLSAGHFYLKLNGKLGFLRLIVKINQNFIPKFELYCSYFCVAGMLFGLYFGYHTFQTSLIEGYDVDVAFTRGVAANLFFSGYFYSLYRLFTISKRNAKYKGV